MPTQKLYVKLFEATFNKEVGLTTDTIKAMLCTSGYTPDAATHKYKSSVTNEITGTGYTAGGATLTSVTASTSGLVFKFDAADSQWTDSTLIARHLVIYKESGSAATSPLIGYVSFDADVSTTSGTFQSIWNSGGIFTISV